MAIDDGLKAVDEVVKNPIWDMRRLMDVAIKRANDELIPPPGFAAGIFFGLLPCKSLYGAQGDKISNEILSWFLGIMFAEYTAGILAAKVTEGHCNEHRKEPDLNPCIDMAKEHKKMLTAFKNRIRKLADEIEALERRTAIPAPPHPASAPATYGS